MNINEETIAANSLLTIHRYYHNYIEAPSLQSFRNNEIRDNRDPNTIGRDLARHRYDVLLEASERSLDPRTRALAQQQLLLEQQGVGMLINNNDYTTKPTGFPGRDQKPIDIERLLSTDGMVMYGSRALNVNRDYSDYDLAFSYESHRFIYNYLRESNIPISDSTEYFTSAPEAGYHTFFKYTENDTKIDIIFVHNDEDLDVIRSSIQDLQSIPSYMLHDKLFRIEAYNKALQHRGWKSTIAIAPGVQGRTFYGARSSRVDRGISPWW